MTHFLRPGGRAGTIIGHLAQQTSAESQRAGDWVGEGRTRRGERGGAGGRVEGRAVSREIMGGGGGQGGREGREERRGRGKDGREKGGWGLGRGVA